jgi:hypothetical protein
MPTFNKISKARLGFTLKKDKLERLHDLISFRDEDNSIFDSPVESAGTL